MSPKQKKIYNYIVRYNKKHGHTPSTLDIARQFQNTSQYIQEVIDILAERGYLKKIKVVPRGHYEVIHR